MEQVMKKVVTLTFYKEIVFLSLYYVKKNGGKPGNNINRFMFKKK